MDNTSMNNLESDQLAAINPIVEGKTDKNRREGTNAKSKQTAEIDPILAQILADEERCAKTYAVDLNEWKHEPESAITYDDMPKWYMEEGIAAMHVEGAFSFPDQLLKKKLDAGIRNCGDDIRDPEARLMTINKALRPLMRYVPKELPPEDKYMLVRIPSYIRVNYKEKSCLDAAQMKNLVDLKMNKAIEPSLSDEAKKEQEEFQSFLKSRWPIMYFNRPHEISDSVKLVIDELQKGRVNACLKNYDHFYKSVGTIALKDIQESDVEFKFGSNVGQPSWKTTIKLPNTLSMDDLSIKLPIAYEEIEKFIEITPSADKLPVCDDKYACQMAQEMSADVVIAGSALETLFSTDGGKFIGEWMLPITVTHSLNPKTLCTVKTIFIDKPLPLPKLTPDEKKKWFVKIATRQFVTNKSTNQEQKCDKSGNNATDQQSLNYCYRLLDLKKGASKEDGSERNNEKPIRILVRSRPLAINISLLSELNEYVVHSTIDYVAEYGASRISRSENLKLWLKLALNPNSSFVRLRYTHTMFLLMTEFSDAKRITQEAMFETPVPPENNFSNVYEILEASLNYPPGNYILSYKSVSGEFANISSYKSVSGEFANIYSPGCDRSDLDLESFYAVPEEGDAKYVKCPEIDTGLLTPYHMYSGVYPAMFPPKKQPPKKKMNRKKPFANDNQPRRKPYATDDQPWKKPYATDNQLTRKSHATDDKPWKKPNATDDHRPWKKPCATDNQP